MAFYKYKGERIRASDKSLVYRFCGGTLLFLFVVVILLLNMGQIMRTDWNTFSLISNDGLTLSLSPYNFITIIVAIGICILVAFLYYCMEKGLLHIQCEITLGKYQDQLLQLEDKLESGLYCELTDKLLYDGYVEYTLLYDMTANRISINEVQAENGGLRLMKNLVWEYDALTHALVCGVN